MSRADARRTPLTTALAALAAASWLGACAASGPPEPVAETHRPLRDGWRIRAAADGGGTGAEISRPGFDASGWTAARVPTTVLAALVASGEVTDPYHGRNLERIDVERFAGPWWYRTEFVVESPTPADARLVLDGVNYSAEVWLNGERIADRAAMTGAFRVFELEVDRRLVAGANALAVLVHPPRPGDPTIGFVDWNPAPPDRSLGLWREVTLRTTRGVSIEEPFVRGDFDASRPQGPERADLTIDLRLANHTDRAVEVELGGRIGPGAEVAFSHRVSLAAGESRAVRLTPAVLPQLALAEPRLWWPHTLGEPHLYRLELDARVDGSVSDRRAVEFGLREFEDYLTPEGHRAYKINGRPLLVRGGGWVDDLLLADDERRLADQVRYVRHLGLDTLRLEGFWGTTHALYELADRQGVLIWVGWSCQWEWETYLGQPVDEQFGGIDTAEEMELVTRSLRDQVVRLRNHPSVVVWNLASDMLPRPELERRYRDLLAEIDPTRPPLAACSVRTSEVSGPTGVKMNGPYEWVPPEYWYLDRERGGAFGFNTETGPGAQPPVAASLRRMLPREHWWPMDEMWDFHAGRNEFASLDRYVAALDARYGESASLDEFAAKAQVASYEAMRPMFEAFSLRRPLATGVVQWMLNSAWPDTFWQLYDWYLVPTGAFYAARNATRPVHVAYDYGERSLVAVNDTSAALEGVTARVRVLDLDSRTLLDESRPLALPAGERREALRLPPAGAGAGIRFLDARLTAAHGATLARNFYWLPATPDRLDWEKSEWFYTPVARFADLTALGRLPAAELREEHRITPTADGHDVEVTLVNPGDRLAFFVELEVVGEPSGRLAAPVLWDDNYVSLLPGDSRRLRATLPAHALPSGDRPVVRYRGYNVPGTGGAASVAKPAAPAAPAASEPEGDRN